MFTIHRKQEDSPPDGAERSEASRDDLQATQHIDNLTAIPNEPASAGDTSKCIAQDRGSGKGKLGCT